MPKVALVETKKVEQDLITNLITHLNLISINFALILQSKKY